MPIDFSKPSGEAIEYALPLIKEFGADLHLVHAFEPDYPFASMATMPLIVPELEVGRRVRRHLKDVASKYAVELRRENIHARKGRPFEEICHLARDRQIDLIVMATRGNTGLKHLLLGSTAERVVRHAPCPVLVVRFAEPTRSEGRNGQSGAGLKIAKILVPVDFSECSLKGVAYAKELARKFDAAVVLLNATPVQYYVANDEYARFDLPLVMQEVEELSRKSMRDLLQKKDWKGLKVTGSFTQGHPGDQICVQAKRQGVDLIVISTHGSTGLEHVLMGSTAEYVVRHAPCPILVVPNHYRSFPSGKRGKGSEGAVELNV